MNKVILDVSREDIQGRAEETGVKLTKKQLEAVYEQVEVNDVMMMAFDELVDETISQVKEG